MLSVTSCDCLAKVLLIVPDVELDIVFRQSWFCQMNLLQRFDCFHRILLQVVTSMNLLCSMFGIYSISICVEPLQTLCYLL